MLYLKASSDIEVLSEYKGEKGVFVKTFAFNDQRNKNGWRVTWDSIKAYIATFEENQRPGIEFMRCDGTQCDLDHIDSTTLAQSIKVQEPFRVTTIVGHVLDEAIHTAYFIHKLNDESFLPKLRSGEVHFVSPAIWPKPGGYTILGKMPNGLPIVDVYEWDGMHDAFLTKDPAFGDVATVSAVCEGEGCMMKLMTAAELKANDLDPLKQVSILVRHKDKLHFVSVSEEIAKEIQALYDENSSVDAEKIISVLKSNNSFSACACSASQMSTVQELEAKISEMKKAMEEKDKESEKKVKELESKLSAQVGAQKAHIISALKAMTENDRVDYLKELKASTIDAKIVSEIEAEAKSFKAKEDPKDDARVKALEAKLAEPMIEKMLAAREDKGMEKEDLATFEKTLRAKSFAEVESQFNSEQIYLKDLRAKDHEEKVHFEFPGTQTTGALTGKTLEEIREAGQ